MKSRTFRLPLIALIVTVLAPGCSIQSMTGDVMTGYARDHMIPYLLEEGDIKAVCGAGVAFGGFLNSFGRVMDPPNRAAVVTSMSAATCAAQASWTEELRSLRAIRAGNSAEAKDARIAQQRAHAVAARRLYNAYLRTVAHYGEPSETCPQLDDEFDELVWLLGLMSLVQGVQHDRAAKGAVGVPLDAPTKAARGIACLNNQRWWHVPEAVQGAIWASVPGSGPKDADPWKKMEEAAQAGDKTGVRLARTVQIQAANGLGKSDILKKSIAAFGKSISSVPPAERWKTLDNYGVLEVQAISDRIWTEAEGHRTPYQSLGELPGGPAPEEEESDDDLLDGLG